MAKASPIQYGFNGGKLGPRLQGRSDLARYAMGCNVLTNFIPTYQGPAVKRSGTRYVQRVYDSSTKTRLIPFEFSREQAYVLELGEGYLRVYKDSGTVLETGVSITNVDGSNPVTVTTSGHSFTNGDTVYLSGTAQSELNGRYFTVSNVSGAAFDLIGQWGAEDGSGRSTGSGGTAARVYTIEDGVSSNSIPWLESELFSISFVQTADVIYLAHGNHPPHKISRTSDTSWTCTEVDFSWPAFRDENIDEDILMLAEQNTGSSKDVWIVGKTDDEEAISSTSNASPVVVTTTGSHGYATGDTVFLQGIATATSLNDKHYVITVTGATTFTLDGTSAPGAAGTGGTASKLLSTDFTFTSDMVGSYVKLRHIIEAHVPQWKAAVNIAGAAGIDARYGTEAIGDLCYYDGNVYSLDSVPGTATGSNPPRHDSVRDGAIGDERADWNFYNKGAGYGEITAVASDGLSCTITVTVDLPYSCSRTNPSKTAHGGTLFDAKSENRWSIGAWNEEYGYPRAVAFYEDRLWFAGSSKDPQTLWGSRTGDYESFEIILDQDDSSVVFTLASDRINAIEWMRGEDVLLLGTKGGEFTADAGTADSAITPSNIRVRRRSFYGSAEGVQPVTVDSATLFVQRSGTRLHELIYTSDPTGYSRLTAPDLTQMSYDILQPGVVEMAYQASPFRLLWCVLSDGSLASLTYIREEDVIAWAKHTLGGTSVVVESVAVIPHPDGDQDQVWMIVKRTVNGSTVRYVEYLERPFENDATEDAFFVDSGLTYSGSAATTITGLHHLEGQTVKVLGDGVVLDDATVSSGSITLGTAVEKAQVGLAMPEAQIQTMRFEAGAQDGTAMGRRKRIHRMVARLNETGEGLRYGANFTTMDEWYTREDGDAMDSPVALFTGDTPSLAMPGGWEQEGRLAVAHAVPLPCTVVSLMPQLSTETR